MKTASRGCRLAATAAAMLVMAACSDEVMVEETPCSDYGEDDEACLQAGCEPGRNPDSPPNPASRGKFGPWLQICYQNCQADTDCPASQSCGLEWLGDTTALMGEYICRTEEEP